LTLLFADFFSLSAKHQPLHTQKAEEQNLHSKCLIALKVPTET